MKISSLIFGALFLLVSCGESQTTEPTGDAAPTAGTATAGNAEATNVTPVTAPTHRNINSKELHEMMANGDIQILDVRTPGETAQGIVPGAKVVDINSADFLTQVKAVIDPAKPVAVYCAMGGRSRRAADQMQADGFAEVLNVSDGYNGWSGNGFEAGQQ